MHLQSSPIKGNFIPVFGARLISLFFLLFIFSFPLGLQFLPDTGKYISSYSGRFYSWFFSDIIGIQWVKDYTIASDTAGLYFHVLVLFSVSLIISFIWTIFNRKKRPHSVYYFWFKTLVVYYLSLILVIYGFNKIFKWQFYLPEPNILFTKSGDIPRDLLYWSVIGTSHSYNVFTGAIELLAALLLLFRPTRLIGAFIAFGVFFNVFIINISFDISVKLFSLFLLVYTLIPIFSEHKRLFAFLFGHKIKSGHKPVKIAFLEIIPLYVGIKSLIIGLILWEAFSVYYHRQNYNGDEAQKPKFHGAYEVVSFEKNSDTIPPLITDTLIWKRVFVHSRGYLIIEKIDEKMQDYKMAINEKDKKMIAISETKSMKFEYKNFLDDLTELNGIVGEDTLKIKLQKISLEQLPLLQNEFHWMINE